MEAFKKHKEVSPLEIKTARAQFLAENNKLDEANRLCLEILDEDFNNKPALFILGMVYINAHHFGIAYNIYKRLLELDPNKSQIWNNLGRTLQDYRDDRIYESIKYFNKAAELEPENGAAYINLSLCYLNLCEPRRCIEYANLGLKYWPNRREALNNRSLAKLMLKDWSGWEDFQNSLGTKQRTELHTEYPRWDGVTPIDTLIVFGEQGIGDEISFASCVNELKKAPVKKVVMDCDERLYYLFKETFPWIDVYPTRFAYRIKENDPEGYEKLVLWKKQYNIEAQCSIASLPLFYRKTDADYPGTPYLKVPAVSTQYVRDTLAKYNLKRMKVGICWTGGIPTTGSIRRNIDFSSLAPILKMDADFISLQYKDFENISTLNIQNSTNVIDLHEITTAKNYDLTCALVKEMDLIITVNTSIVHVAGALGVQCWTLTPEKPRWFYGLSGSTCVWYKSVKIFRQKNGKWPIQQVANRLRRLINDSTGFPK